MKMIFGQVLRRASQLRGPDVLWIARSRSRRANRLGKHGLHLLLRLSAQNEASKFRETVRQSRHQME
jgi:hypothetical protein